MRVILAMGVVCLALLVCVASCRAHSGRVDAGGLMHEDQLVRRTQHKQQQQYVVPPSEAPEASYGPWAHSHWVWWGRWDANSTSNYQLVQDYLSRNISVGAVDFDSNWESDFSDLLPSANYSNPDMPTVIAAVHALNVRVIVWATSMIDQTAPNFQYAQTNNYFILNGFGQTGIMKWWHGHGALLDYTNPAAVSWWHGQMDKVFAWGIDGWKTDGTDPYIIELISPKTSSGQPIDWREYADQYYGDFFDYSRSKNPEALIMSRPVDSIGGVYVAYSPLRVMTSGWVGDNNGDFTGLEDCAKKVLQSAWRNYANFGCDIDGYKKGNRTRELIIRWSAFGAFLPLMENGGTGDHRPWVYDEGQANTTLATDMYRLFVDAHETLSPYLLTTGSNALDTQTSSLSPQTPNVTATNTTIAGFNPSTYAYMLGDNVFVNPIISSGVTSISTTFPAAASNGSQWCNFFVPAQCFQPEETQLLPVSLDDTYPYPAFVASGQPLALQVTSDSLPLYGLGSAWRASLDLEQQELAELGPNAGKTKGQPMPLSLVIVLHPSLLSSLAQSGEVVRSTNRRFQLSSLEIAYTVEQAEDGSYTLEAEISATGADKQQAPIILVLVAAGDAVTEGDLDTAPAWNTGAMKVQATTEVGQVHVAEFVADQEQLHRSSTSAVVVANEEQTIFVKPASTAQGAQIKITGLVHVQSE